MDDRGAVVVTGASTGIGEACARLLAAEGYQVFAGVRKAADATRLQEATPALVPLALDVTDARSVEAAAEEVERRIGRRGLAGLVNNAGIAVAGPLEYLPIDDLRRQFDVNVVGVVAATQAFLPALRRATGRIVVIGSIAGRMSNAFLGPYAASKFAVAALCDAWRGELAPWGIEVVLVEPGEIATPIWDKGLEDGDRLEAQLPPEAIERYGAVIETVRKMARRAAKNGASPDTVARVVLDALSTPRPSTRYLVGSDAWLRSWVAMLPDRWRDVLVRKALNLPSPGRVE